MESSERRPLISNIMLNVYDNPSDDDDEEVDEIVQETLATILINQRTNVRQIGNNIASRYYVCSFCSRESPSHSISD